MPAKHGTTTNQEYLSYTMVNPLIFSSSMVQIHYSALQSCSKYSLIEQSSLQGP